MGFQPFRDRTEAGRLLAQHLTRYAHQPDVVVLGLPRGGIPVAAEIARILNVSLDFYLVRKLGVPDQPELAMGAIASSGTRYLNFNIIRQCQIEANEIERITQQEWQELERRNLHYRQGRPPPNLTGKTVIVVDDGIATGATLFAALASLRQQPIQALIVAIPVAPAASLQRLNAQTDDIVCLIAPALFHSVGQWYLDFSQTSDEQVCRLLTQFPRALDC
jgi:putative phosphoribosyl transferase